MSFYHLFKRKADLCTNLMDDVPVSVKMFEMGQVLIGASRTWHRVEAGMTLCTCALSAGGVQKG